MAKKITVVINALTDRHRRQIEATAARYGYTVAFYQSNREAIAHLSDSEVVYGFGKKLAEAATGAKWFCSSSAGMDVYRDTAIYQREDVLLSNSSGAYGVTIAEHIVMVTLELLRRQMEYMRIVREKRWVRNLSIRSIKGSRITILGTGDLGRLAASRFRGFAPARVTGVNRRGICDDPVFDVVCPQPEVDRLLPETDILIMCLPGTRETDRFMDARRLALLPSHAVLVNVGRGNAVDQRALADLLEADQLAGASLDVFEEEPIPRDDPIWTCKNLLITPHIAGNMTLEYTVDYATDLFCEDLENYCNGLPLNRQVDCTLGY